MIDFPIGIRSATTFIKLPTLIPSRKTIKARIISSILYFEGCLVNSLIISSPAYEYELLLNMAFTAPARKYLHSSGTISADLLKALIAA